MRTPASRLCVLAGLVVVLGACGGSGEQAGEIPGCAEAGEPITLPAAFPRSFPLPPGTVIDKERRQAGQFTVVEGFVPGVLGDNQYFFLEELPKAGFRLGEGDAEEHEAETDFSGHGFQGHLKIHDIPGCEGALTLEVVTVRGQ